MFRNSLPPQSTRDIQMIQKVVGQRMSGRKFGKVEVGIVLDFFELILSTTNSPSRPKGRRKFKVIFSKALNTLIKVQNFETATDVRNLRDLFAERFNQMLITDTEAECVKLFIELVVTPPEN